MCGRLLCDTTYVNAKNIGMSLYVGKCGSVVENAHPRHKNSLSYFPDGTYCGEGKVVDCESKRLKQKNVYHLLKHTNKFVLYERHEYT